jgi:hypothetical protein
VRREFRVYGVSMTPARYPVSFWIGLGFQLVVGGFIIVFLAGKVLIPTVAFLLAK